MRKIPKGLVRLQMQPPLPDGLAHIFASLVAHPRGEADKELAITILGPPGTKGLSQKVEFRFRKSGPHPYSTRCASCPDEAPSRRQRKQGRMLPPEEPLLKTIR